MKFRDRQEAGGLLGEELSRWSLHDPLVLGIPRGGIVVGVAIADRIGADLDVVLAHKLRAPLQPELAIGALGEDGQVYLNRHVEATPGFTDKYLQHERQLQYDEIDRRRQLFRAVHAARPIAGRSVVLTDDGIATGSTMFAAIQCLRGQKPRELILAVPVAPAKTVDQFRNLCDRMVCLHPATTFWGVGEFYASFEPVSDDEVLAVLSGFGKRDC